MHVEEDSAWEFISFATSAVREREGEKGRRNEGGRGDRWRAKEKRTKRREEERVRESDLDFFKILCAEQRQNTSCNSSQSKVH